MMILPIIHQYVAAPTDIPVGFYVSVVRTTTHEFTLLAVEHSRDTKVIGGHEWDLEGVLIVERNWPQHDPQFEGMFTQAHNDWRPYSSFGRHLSQGRRLIKTVAFPSGRPDVWIEPHGHGIYGHDLGLKLPIEVFSDYPTARISDLGPRFSQDEHGRWRSGGAHAPWSWATRIGYPGLVLFDPVQFLLESGVQGWSLLSRQYTLNEFVNIPEGGAW